MKSILGIDPGFAALGVARLELCDHDREHCSLLDVFTTKPANKKRNTLAADDNMVRAFLIAEYLEGMITTDTVAIAAEAMSYPRNASAAAKMAICWGIIASVAHRHKLPLIQSSPQEIKKSICDNKSASKEDVQHALELRYDDLPDWPFTMGLREHSADALAAAVVALRHPVILGIRKMIGEGLAA